MWLCFASIPTIRHCLYESFYWLHQVGFICEDATTLTSDFHLPVIQCSLFSCTFIVTEPWVLGLTYTLQVHNTKIFSILRLSLLTVVIFGVALIARVALSTRNHLAAPTATLHVQNETATLIKVPIQKRSWFKLNWSGGQYFYLRFFKPTLQPYTSHPFTVANLENDTGKYLKFLVRTNKGFTRHLAREATKHEDVPLRVWLDGPYGTLSSAGFSACQSILFIAGGTGITFGFPILLELLQASTVEKSLGKQFHLIWSVKHRCK